jgi:TolA-binding protein
MKLPRALAVLAAGVALSSAGAALAQTPIDDTLDQRSAKRLDEMEKVVKELRAVVFQGRDTGQPIVVQPADTDGRVNALSDRLNDLDRTLARLNGQVEEIRHDLDEARRQDVDLATQNTVLQARVAAVEQQLKAAVPPPGPTASDDATSASPAAAFAAARAELVAGDTANAEVGFHDFVAQYGDTPLGPEARYYLGRTLIDRRAWPDAAAADIGAIRGWPQAAWAPRAVLDLSRALHGMGKDAEVCQTLGELARRYPRSTADVKTGAAALRRDARCG